MSETAWLQQMADEEKVKLLTAFQDFLRKEWGDPLPKCWSSDWSTGWDTAISFVRAQLVGKIIAETAERERDEARAQLAEATARVVVLEAALRIARDQLLDLSLPAGCAAITIANDRLRNPNPLAVAVGRVVEAAMDWCEKSEKAIGVEDPQFRDFLVEWRTSRQSIVYAVDALRALAPNLKWGQS